MIITAEYLSSDRFSVSLVVLVSVLKILFLLLLRGFSANLTNISSFFDVIPCGVSGFTRRILHGLNTFIASVLVLSAGIESLVILAVKLFMPLWEKVILNSVSFSVFASNSSSLSAFISLLIAIVVLIFLKLSE